MQDKDIREVCERSVIAHGIPAQTEMMEEEMDELGLALHHYKRGRVKEDAVITEIADVIIMARQMAYIFGYEEVNEEITRKIERQRKRLESRKEEPKGKPQKEYYGF